MELHIKQEDLRRMTKEYVKHLGIDLDKATIELEFRAGRKHPSYAVVHVLETTDTFVGTVIPDAAGDLDTAGPIKDTYVPEENVPDSLPEFPADGEPSEAESQEVVVGLDQNTVGTDSVSVADFFSIPSEAESKKVDTAPTPPAAEQVSVAGAIPVEQAANQKSLFGANFANN